MCVLRVTLERKCAPFLRSLEAKATDEPDDLWLFV